MSLRDYIRLTKPKILPLLIVVALASAVIADRGLPSLRVLVGLFIAGTLASGGALALNSYLEVDVDSKMRRTKNRPLPAHRIVEPRRALAFASSLLALGMIIAYVALNLYATLFIALGAVIYVPVYTLWLKPRTSWNIVLGGFAGSCSALAGWYAVTTADPLIAWILAALVFVWTPTHFWSLAVIAEDDYSAAGIPMLPSVVGGQRAARFIVANTLLLIPISLLFFLYLSGTGEIRLPGGGVHLRRPHPRHQHQAPPRPHEEQRVAGVQVLEPVPGSDLRPSLRRRPGVTARKS